MSKLSREIIVASVLAYKAEQELNAISHAVLYSQDKSVERTFDEDELLEALQRFKAAYDRYTVLVNEYHNNKQLPGNLATEVYQQAKVRAERAPEVEQEAIFDAEMHEALERLSQNTDTTQESIDSDSDFDLEENTSSRVALLKKRFEAQQKPNEPFKERRLPGQEVTKKVNTIEMREHMSKLRQASEAKSLIEKPVSPPIKK